MDLTQLPPFDSLQDGDIVTIRGVVRRNDDTYPGTVDLNFVDSEGTIVDALTINHMDYADYAVAVERAS